MIVIVVCGHGGNLSDGEHVAYMDGDDWGLRRLTEVARTLDWAQDHNWVIKSHADGLAGTTNVTLFLDVGRRRAATVKECQLLP
jgi:hypothetical protein